jgi:hypothetical protein
VVVVVVDISTFLVKPRPGLVSQISAAVRTPSPSLSSNSSPPTRSHCSAAAAYQNDTKILLKTKNQNRRKAKSKEQQTTNNQHKTQGTSSFFFFRFLLLSEPRGARIIGAHQKLARNNSTTRAKNRKAKKPITFQICF